MVFNQMPYQGMHQSEQEQRDDLSRAMMGEPFCGFYINPTIDNFPGLFRRHGQQYTASFVTKPSSHEKHNGRIPV
jgi:hypothetical protein